MILLIYYRGLLDSSNSIIADPILLYSGNIDTFEISETETQSNVKLIIVSHWVTLIRSQVEKQIILLNKDFLVQMLVWILQVKQY